VARLFKSVVWISTGSGIAPALPHLLNDPTPAQLVWVTRHPEKTYGAELVAEIRGAQPNAILWNTDEHGRADLTELAYRAYVESGAEAVICISNKKATLKLVQELGQRGIPAYGPIWDS
jgi:ferredoxin-NADP reductase